MNSPTPDEIKAARERSGLTQSQAAALAGYKAQPRWAELEAGRLTIEPWRWRYFLHVAGVERIPFRSCTYAPLGDK